ANGRGRDRRRGAEGADGRPGAARGGGLVDRPRFHRGQAVDDREAEVRGAGDGVLRVGILKTGRPPRACIPKFGTYPDMFMGLLGPDAYDWRTFDVEAGELPKSPTACDAY